jgi:hypothetical protein
MKKRRTMDKEGQRSSKANMNVNLGGRNGT